MPQEQPIIDWSLDKSNADPPNDPFDLGNGWYTAERKVGLLDPTLRHGIAYVKDGLAKAGFATEVRIRQPIGDSFDGNHTPCVIVFARKEGDKDVFAHRDAVQTAWAGGTADGSSGARGPYTTLASILGEWGEPIVAEKMPPFYPLDVVAAQSADPVGDLIKDGSGVHYEVSANFDPAKHPVDDLFTRTLPNGDYSVFVRTTFSRVTGFMRSDSRPGWRQMR